jgi:hypothetical protein
MRTDNPIRHELNWLRAACGVVGVGLLVFFASNQATAAGWTGMDLGAPAFPGSVTDNAGTITILAGGSDIWGTSDNGYYYYQPVTSPVWDAVVRVQSLVCPGTSGANDAEWAKVELMVRMDQGTGFPEGSDAFIAEMTTQPATYQTIYGDTGVNWVVDQFRTAASGNADWIDNTTWSTVSHAYTAGNPSPAYPNQWLRVTRVGSVFTTMDSTDGVNWSTSAVLDTSNSSAQPAGNDNGTRFTTPFSGNLFIGVAVTSHDNAVDDSNCATAIISDLKLTVQTDLLFIDKPVGLPVGFDMPIIQAGAAVLDKASVKLTFDDQLVTATSTNTSLDGGTITFRYVDIANPLVSGSTHTVKLDCKDTRGVASSATQTFTVPTYATVPPDYATTTYSTPGMAVSVIQINVPRGPDDGNFTKNAETQMADGFIDPATGLPYDNLADLTLATMGQFFVDFVNWEQAAGDIDATPDLGPDHFNSARPTDNPVPNAGIPGVPGLSDNPTDNIVTMTTTYLDLKRGWYKMCVNSDDGFKVSVAPGAPDAYGLTLGEYNGGRGASDTVFDFFVQQDGVYPTRLLYWEGNGGANVEWFSIDVDTGERTLVGYESAKAVKAYRAGQGRAYIKSLLPYPGKIVQELKPTIKAVLVNGSTTVGSIQLTVDGATVTPTISPVGGTTTVTYQFPTVQAFGSQHTNVFSYVESTTPPTTRTITSAWTVRSMGVDDMPPAPPTFVIEAEDFDYDGGLTMPEASVMPYYGGAYLDLGASLNIDFFNNDGDDSQAYRSPLMPGNGNNADIDTQTGAGTLDMLRPGYEVTTNCKIGWADGADWYNYTRDIPAGFYTAFSAQSQGGGLQYAGISLNLVTAGVGTTTQTLQNLCVCGGLTTAGTTWGDNSLMPAKNADGSTTVFKLPGGTVTLRVNMNTGDYDWFVLVPMPDAAPRVDLLLLDSVKRNEVVVDWNIVNLATTVNTNSVKLEVDGKDLTAKCTVTPNADGAAVQFNDTGTMYSRGAHPYTLSFLNNKGAACSSSYFINVNCYPSASVFVIEAEDFNYESGKTLPQASVMPYLGNAYAGLDAINGIDYNSSDDRSAQEYRPPLNSTNPPPHQNINISRSEGDRYCMDRGIWTVTANFKIGWAGSGKWENFTRTFPANDYEVWAALSYGDRSTGGLHAYLDMVTSDPTTTGQTTSRVGTFDAPGTGGWGRNELVPMKDAVGGTNKTIAMGGTQTVRFYDQSGDFDYLVFVPLNVSGLPPTVNLVTLDSCKRNEVVVDWNIVNMDTTVNVSTVKVEVNGGDVTAKCAITSTASGAAVHLDDTGTTYPSGAVPYKVSFSDSKNAACSSSGLFNVNCYPAPGVFVIEAEDFNYESGKTNPQKGVAGLDVDVMPYLGGAYTNLSAINGIDYNSTDGREAQEYRPPLNVDPHQNVQISRNEGNRYTQDRGVWETTVNFKIGWGTNGKWDNYTRTFPAGTYEVWAALAYDGRAPSQLNGSLDMVTSDPAQTAQTTQPLGVFNAPGSGGWGRNELVPMKDVAGGTIKNIPLGGVQTVRFTFLGGSDFDYLVFVPLNLVHFTAWRINTDGTMTLEWTGGGTLQAAPAVTGPWQDVTDAVSPYTFAPTQKILFGRIIQR